MDNNLIDFKFNGSIITEKGDLSELGKKIFNSNIKLFLN